jgi:hypothetical protein
MNYAFLIISKNRASPSGARIVPTNRPVKKAHNIVRLFRLTRAPKLCYNFGASEVSAYFAWG